MRNKWFRILAIALCALMLLTVAPTSAPTAAEDAERPTDAQTENEYKAAPESPTPKADIISDEPLTVGENIFEIPERLDYVYRPFTPAESGKYLFYSVSDRNTVGVLYRSQDGSVDFEDYLEYNDDGGEGGNFEFSHFLTAGRTYYLRVNYLYFYDYGPVTVMIEKLPENACGNHLTWTFDEATGTLTVDGYGNMWGYIDEQDVPWYSHREQIVLLSLPDGLSSIGSHAFASCTALSSVAIPDGVTRVNLYSFYDCLTLASVTLPISLRRVETEGFGYAPALSDVYYRGTEEQRAYLRITDYNLSNIDLINAEWHYLGLPCPHKNALDNASEDGFTYEDVGDDLWHKMNYTITYCVYCPDCNEEISTGETVPAFRMEQHYYDDDGVCEDCGHVNQCRHQNLEVWTDWYESDDAVYTDTGDDREHVVSGHYYCCSCCRDCGAYWRELRSGTIHEQHCYGELGTCLDCGHEDACTHPDGFLYRYEWEKATYEEYDETYHLTYGWRGETAYCPICLFDQLEYNGEILAMPEEHEYDSHGYCRKCGYQSSGAAVECVVEWNASDVKYKGSTAYVIANGSAQTPRFTVKNKADGSVIDPANYNYEYRENRNAGTGYVFVTLKGPYYGNCRGTFKIYLPATTATTVANVKDGIKLTWSKVEGADGYVIYRRAWSSTTNGWTDFVRWNNTTALNWTDTKVYAGTRYQYGIKAYFNKRSDLATGSQLGGNVGDNFNLGEVGPLKTTVRITTRVLNSVTAGTKQMTVKWGASSVFTGYQIQYATNSAFTQNAKAIKINNPKTASTVIKSLTSGKTYYVRVRSYHEFNGMTYFGEWSNVKSCKVK